MNITTISNQMNSTGLFQPNKGEVLIGESLSQQLVDEINNSSSEGLTVIGELKKIIESMNKSAIKKDRANLIEADFQFHNIIIKGCKNTLFTSLFETLRSFLYDEIKQSQTDYTDLTEIPKEHDILLDALLTGKKSSVYSAYSNHISNIKERLRN